MAQCQSVATTTEGGPSPLEGVAPLASLLAHCRPPVDPLELAGLCFCLSLLPRCEVGVDTESFQFVGLARVGHPELVGGRGVVRVRELRCVERGDGSTTAA